MSPAEAVDTVMVADAMRRRHLGDLVHVRDEAAHECRVAVVLGLGVDGYTGIPSLRLRVYGITPAGSAVGSSDAEGYYRHHAERRWVRSPNGPDRPLDSYHTPYLSDACME